MSNFALNVMKRCECRIAGNFEGANFHEFQGFVAICESFLHKIWGRGIIWRHQRAICERFLRKKTYFPPI